MFLPPRLNGQTYLQFLRETLPGLLENIPLNVRQAMVFQHDGAPPHITRAVTNHLNRNFPDNWIGRNGPILWPPRSPDLTPLDYFLWGCIKEVVYRTPIQTEEECRRRIVEAFADIAGRQNDILRATTNNFIKRAELVLEHQGRHIEQYL